MMAHDNVVRICFTSACYSGQNERPFSDYTNIIQFQPKIVFRNLHPICMKELQLMSLMLLVKC